MLKQYVKEFEQKEQETVVKLQNIVDHNNKYIIKVSKEKPIVDKLEDKIVETVTKVDNIPKLQTKQIDNKNNPKQNILAVKNDRKQLIKK